MSTSKKKLSADQVYELLATVERRFQKNMNRHKGLDWSKVRARLEAKADKLWSLYEMERTGGEPDVVAFEKETGDYVLYDCAPESPTGRRSLCYDRAALESRREHKPKDSAMAMAAAMGVELLNEAQYRKLQDLGRFDAKTSSWLETPAPIRKLGGAIFGDWRYGQVFIYHNGAESYYAARGFRAALRV
jgi:class 3 adenylate cyclase